MLRGTNELEAIIATSLGVLGEKDFDWRREKLYTVIESAETEEDVDSDEGDE